MQTLQHRVAPKVSERLKVLVRGLNVNAPILELLFALLPVFF